MRSESFPCLVCGKILYRGIEEYEAQPDDGVMCATSGNYGSMVYDPMDGTQLAFNLCDDCVTHAAALGRLHIVQVAIKVVTDSVIHLSSGDRVIESQVGWKHVDRPYLPWNVEMGPVTEHERLTIEEVLARLDNDRYRWNLPRENFEYMQRELDDYDKEHTS